MVMADPSSEEIQQKRYFGPLCLEAGIKCLERSR